MKTLILNKLWKLFPSTMNKITYNNIDYKLILNIFLGISSIVMLLSLMYNILKA